VVDAATNTLLAGIAVPRNPRWLAVTPDGRKLYVGHGGLSGFLTVIDTRTLAITRTLAVSVTGPMAFNLTGSRLYVPAQGAVIVIDTVADSMAGLLNVNGWRAVVSPDGQRIYVHSMIMERVEVFSAANHAQLGVIAVRGAAGPQSPIVMAPNGARLYVSQPLQLAALDPRTNTVAASITFSETPTGLAVSADSATVVVTAGGVQLVDAAANTIRGAVASPAFGNPILHPSGSRVFVAASGGVAVLDTRPALASLPAASFASGAAFAPESIASAFGRGLASATQSAPSLPLPTSLAGTTVRVRDSARVDRLAPLFFVSPGQINYLVPAGTSSGLAEVTVTSRDQVVAFGTLRVEPVAPALFSANADGRGVAAAVALRFGADGAQTALPVFQCGAAPGSCAPAPLDLGAETDQAILILFGTGIRGRTGPAAVRAAIGGVAADVLYAGPQGDFAGLDQVNLPIPRVLAGRGEVDVLLVVDGRSANPVRVRVQ